MCILAALGLALRLGLGQLCGHGTGEPTGKPPVGTAGQTGRLPRVRRAKRRLARARSLGRVKISSVAVKATLLLLFLPGSRAWLHPGPSFRSTAATSVGLLHGESLSAEPTRLI